MPDDPMSLFGSSSKKKEKKRSQDRAAEGTKEFLSLEPSVKEAAEPSPVQTISDEEVDGMIVSIREKQIELEKRLSEIMSQGNILPQSLQDLLKDLSNWPLQKQKEIVAKANKMIEGMTDIVGPEQIAVQERKKEKKDEKRTQKAQKIRAKRNWISMQ